MNYTKLASKKIVDKTIKSLAANGISAELVETGEKAKEKMLSLIPIGAEIMNMTSATLEEIGIPEIINNSGKYNSIRNKLSSMDRKTQSLEMQKLGAAPEWAIGSAQSITQDGKVLLVSNTGSQLPAYAYGAAHIIWVVGTQKIVSNIDEGMKRIEEYIVPKESQRAQKAYNLPEFNTNISKVLIVNKETKPGRIHIIFVNQNLGF